MNCRIGSECSRFDSGDDEVEEREVCHDVATQKMEVNAATVKNHPAQPR